MSLSVFFIYQITIILSNAFCEQINLYGDRGQAYAVEVYVGHPHQKLNLILDTGSTTLAIASYSRDDGDEFFHKNYSHSLYMVPTDAQIHASYSQGTWTGLQASDFIQFPSLTGVPEVRTDFALITKSDDFFISGSAWQGILGLAYTEVGAWGRNGLLDSWLDAVDRNLNKPISFTLKLCGQISQTNTTHYGYFNVFDNHTPNPNPNKMFRTPVLCKGWYEVGVISIRVLRSMTPELDDKYAVEDIVRDPDFEECTQLNAMKGIVDSGTTQIKLPHKYFKQVVNELKDEFRKAQVLILDEFWDNGEFACWPEPQNWTSPWLAIDLLSAEADNQYFTLEIPPQNYMLVGTMVNSSDTNGTVPMYCYKLGLLEGDVGTVVGFTAMEGFQVLFNRSANWIGWQTSDCGANVRITGPYNASTSLKVACHLTKREVVVLIEATQWALCAISIIAGCVLLYLLAPCIKMLIVRRMSRSQQNSLSQASLVDLETY